jgi:hypothetical protein
VREIREEREREWIQKEEGVRREKEMRGERGKKRSREERGKRREREGGMEAGIEGTYRDFSIEYPSPSNQLLANCTFKPKSASHITGGTTD